MFLEEIPENVKTTTPVKIKYDCNGGFERCGKEWTLKYKDANKNFNDNKGKHICRRCGLVLNNPGKREDVKKKIEKTNKERYGGLAMNTKEQIEKRKKECYTPERLAEREKKSKATSQKKYGADHFMKTEQGVQKLKEIFQEKYGVDNPLQDEDILKRQQQTLMERYGVDNIAKLPEIQVKMAETRLEKYGVEHYNQLPEMREYLRENCKEWLAESYANPWAKGIKRPEEWNRKQSETMTEKILKGEFNPEDKRFYVTGFFISDKCRKSRAFFRSSLELRMHYILHHDDEVEWYENEPFRIQYEKKPGVIRNYVPDFVVSRRDKRPLLIEIKPSFRMREQEVQIKVEVAKEYCENNNLDFDYIDEHYLKVNSPSFEEIKLLSNVEIKKPSN